MKQKDFIAKAAALLKIKPEDFEAAVKAEPDADVSVTIDEKLTSYTEAEITTLKSNTYKEGKLAGVEMEVDAIKKEAGLEFTGKTLKGLLDSYGKKVLADAKIEPEKKVAELTEQITTLKTTVHGLETKLSEKDQEVSGIRTNFEVLKHIPEKTSLPGDKVVGLMKMDGYNPVFKDGKLVWEKDGKVLQDHLGEPLPAKSVVENYVKENKLTSEVVPAGRGRGDGNPTGKPQKLSELKKDFEAQGKSVLGDEFQNAAEQAKKENPDFDMAA